MCIIYKSGLLGASMASVRTLPLMYSLRYYYFLESCLYHCMLCIFVFVIVYLICKTFQNAALGFSDGTHNLNFALIYFVQLRDAIKVSVLFI